MANVAKYTKTEIGGLSNHLVRAKDKKGEYHKHNNQEIDPSRSHLNYNLAPHNLKPQQFITQRITEVQCLNRKDVNVMCSWVVTKPVGVKAEEQDLFFKETYKFLEKQYGKENVAGAWVHLDEVSPHMHFSFVPVVLDKKKEKLKVSAKDVINRNTLLQFHPKLEKHLEKVFGREVGILNDATKEGNKSIDELKKETAIKTLNELKNFEEFKNTPESALEKLVAKMLPKEYFKTFKQVELLEQDMELLKIENNTLKTDIKSKDSDIEAKNKKIINLEEQNTLYKTKADRFTIHKMEAYQGKGVPLTNSMYHDLVYEIKARIKKAVPEIDEKVLDNALRDSNPVFRELIKAPKPVQTLGLGE